MFSKIPHAWYTPGWKINTAPEAADWIEVLQATSSGLTIVCCPTMQGAVKIRRHRLRMIRFRRWPQKLFLGT